jgi:hypothetical protein
MKEKVVTKEIEDTCKELGISPRSYRSRIRRGWTKEEALLVPKLRAVFEINGETVYSYLKRIGKSYNLFQHKIRSGYSVEDAVKYVETHETRKRIKK